MKKIMIVCMTAILAMTTVLTGCKGTVTINMPAKPVAAAVQEATAGFDVSDVYKAPEQKPSVDISECDTFTQIVDKLDAGKAYANAKVWNTDVLMVASNAYKWEPGKDAATDADIFFYKDGIPTYIATVSSGGTAYPLQIKDGYLYVGGNHFMTKYLIDDGNLIEAEEAYVKYDKDGNATYYYKTCNSQFEDYDQATAKERFDELFAEQEGSDIIEFQPIEATLSTLS